MGRVFYLVGIHSKALQDRAHMYIRIVVANDIKLSREVCCLMAIFDWKETLLCFDKNLPKTKIVV